MRNAGILETEEVCLQTGKGNRNGKKSSDQVFHETVHAVEGF